MPVHHSFIVMSGSSTQTARGSLSTETTNNKTVTTAGVTTTTQYLVEDDVNPTGYPQVLDELTGPIGSAAVTRTYTYGLQRISQDQIAGNVLSYYQYDGGGSVRQLTNSVGQVTDSYEYDAFGNSFTKVGTTPNNYLYRGEQYDSDLGLYYLRARYYNPATGRFLSRDPEDGGAIDPGSLHKYLYANGDPVNGWDPDGRADEEESGLKFALIEDAALPALREFVGDFIRLQAIPWIVRGARSTAAAARVVAIFLEDVARTKLAKGLLKLYVCYELGVLFVDLTLDLDVAHISEDARKSYERLADAGMIYVCSEHML